ncbi:restriction endonuclease subunit S [Acinetobacter nosocomialis]|uniref:restriction endonuclease subunit S n=1 Tax=Acinetobacter nosocomialis TaxID=106654 RepID=UPI001F24A732|nr:restriction endonuclease subunit S [Acinetobacter nosocomialis]MCE7532963.1 restriction endonuclease subunit S [Acinetobacter nosocomialis]
MSVPKLRFKEFDGEWAKTSFQDLFIFKNGVNASKEQYGSGIKFINVLDIINNPNGITYDSIIGSVDITSKEIDKNLVKYGDVLFQRSSETREEVGQSNVYLGKEPVVFGGFVIRGSAQKEYDPIFMNGLLKTDSLRDQITQLSGGSTRFNIGQDSLNKVSAYLPSKLEQTKIASFLSAVDEKIKQLTQKHELLSQYKQGMMQKLFSQQIRFKADDGSEFEEWEKTILGKIGIFLKGKGISKADIVQNGAIPCIRYGELYTQYGEVISNVISATNLEVNSLVLSKANDVLIPASGETQIDIATASCVLQSEVALSGDLNIFRTEENGVFLSYLIRSHLKMQIAQLAQGNSVVHLYSSQLKGVQLNLPCLEEQTKIANFLSAIDQKIEVVVQQIKQVKQWKKGLLQQMFV